MDPRGPRASPPPPGVPRLRGGGPAEPPGGGGAPPGAGARALLPGGPLFPPTPPPARTRGARPRDVDPRGGGGPGGERGAPGGPRVHGYFVRAPVFPFNRFPREDTVLGPEMKSTGEVMGSSPTFGEAYAKALLGAGVDLPRGGTAFISVNDNDKRPTIVQLARDLQRQGFRVIATSGTREFLEQNDVEAGLAFKGHETERPNIVHRMINGDGTLVINTPLGRNAFIDDTYIRRTALQHGIPCITTLSAAAACIDAIRALREGLQTFVTLQEQHGVVSSKV